MTSKLGNIPCKEQSRPRCRWCRHFQWSTGCRDSTFCTNVLTFSAQSSCTLPTVPDRLVVNWEKVSIGKVSLFPWNAVVVGNLPCCGTGSYLSRFKGERQGQVPPQIASKNLPWLVGRNVGASCHGAQKQRLTTKGTPKRNRTARVVTWKQLEMFYSHSFSAYLWWAHGARRRLLTSRW